MYSKISLLLLYSQLPCLHSVKSATLNGTLYKKENVIVCDVVDEEPTFGLIQDIFYTNTNETYFIVCMLHTVRFCIHFNAYEVEKTSTVVMLVQKQFCDYYPLNLCKSLTSTSSYFVCLKYRVLSLSN